MNRVVRHPGAITLLAALLGLGSELGICWYAAETVDPWPPTDASNETDAAGAELWAVDRWNDWCISWSCFQRSAAMPPSDAQAFAEFRGPASDQPPPSISGDPDGRFARLRLGFPRRWIGGDWHAERLDEGFPPHAEDENIREAVFGALNRLRASSPETTRWLDPVSLTLDSLILGLPFAAVLLWLRRRRAVAGVNQPAGPG